MIDEEQVEVERMNRTVAWFHADETGKQFEGTFPAQAGW